MIVIFLKINQIFLNYQKYFPTQKKEPHTRYGSLCLSFLFTTFTATSQNLLQLAYGNEILACMSQDFVTFAPKHLGGLRAQGGGEGGSCGLRNSELLPPISCSPPLSSSPCLQKLYFLLCCLIFRVDFQILLRLFQSSSKIQFFLISHNLVKQKALHFFCGCHGNS